MYEVIEMEDEKLDDQKKKLIELITKLNEYRHFLTAFKSDSAFDLFIELNNNEKITELIRNVEENIRKTSTKKILTFRNDDLLREYTESEMRAYERGFTTGLNLGRILTFMLIDCIIKNKLVQIDYELNNPELKLLAVYLYFFGDEKNVNDFEEAIIKQLHQLGLSYRKIAKLTGRSLETIHRYIKS